MKTESATIGSWRDRLVDLRLRIVTAGALVLLALASAGLWVTGLQSIEPRAITDVGVVSEMTPPMFAAFVPLSIGFGLALRMRPLVVPLLAFQVAVLIFMLYGLGVMIHEVPRFSTTWVHAGITETITRTGELYPLADARFDWPVFFILLAFLTEVAGLENAIELAAWIPVLSNLLYIVPLLLIFSAATSDRRLVWLAIWVFGIANWVGQDYLSPQGFNYLLYLTILGILLRWFAPPSSGSIGWIDRLRERIFGPLRPDAVAWQHSALDVSATANRQRLILAGIVVLMYAVVVSSHQLTPFALLGSVAALVILRRCRLRGLPVLMAVMLGTWLSFMSVTYLAGHLPALLAQIGDAENLISANVGGRIAGNPEHETVIYLRLAMTAGVWMLALLGGIRRLRTGYWDIALAALAIVPFGTLILQSYGGELLLRVYLFSLPFMAFFVAALFYPTPGFTPIRRSAAIVGVSLAFMVLFMFARYGNERAELQTVDEVQAVDFLHSVARPGDLIASITGNSVIRYRNFELHPRVYLAPLMTEKDAGSIAAALRRRFEQEAYLIITRSQTVGLEVFAGMPAPYAEDVINALRRLPDFHVIYENRDAVIFALDPLENG